MISRGQIKCVIRKKMEVLLLQTLKQTDRKTDKVEKIDNNAIIVVVNLC